MTADVDQEHWIHCAYSNRNPEQEDSLTTAPHSSFNPLLRLLLLRRRLILGWLLVLLVVLRGRIELEEGLALHLIIFVLHLMIRTSIRSNNRSPVNIFLVDQWELDVS